VVAIVDIGGGKLRDEDSVEVLQSSATDESVALFLRLSLRKLLKSRL
jgi:hypothetical protein